MRFNSQINSKKYPSEIFFYIVHVNLSLNFELTTQES